MTTGHEPTRGNNPFMSEAHTMSSISNVTYVPGLDREKMASRAGFEPATLGLAYLLQLSLPLTCLGSGLYLHHAGLVRLFRWEPSSLCTFLTISC